MTYVLVVWYITHMHVVEMHPRTKGAEFYPNLQACVAVGEAVTNMFRKRHAQYRCEIQV